PHPGAADLREKDELIFRVQINLFEGRKKLKRICEHHTYRSSGRLHAAPCDQSRRTARRRKPKTVVVTIRPTRRHECDTAVRTDHRITKNLRGTIEITLKKSARNSRRRLPALRHRV